MQKCQDLLTLAFVFGGIRLCIVITALWYGHISPNSVIASLSLCINVFSQSGQVQSFHIFYFLPKFFCDQSHKCLDFYFRYFSYFIHLAITCFLFTFGTNYRWNIFVLIVLHLFSSLSFVPIHSVFAQSSLVILQIWHHLAWRSVHLDVAWLLRYLMKSEISVLCVYIVLLHNPLVYPLLERIYRLVGEYDTNSLFLTGDLVNCNRDLY